MKRTTAIVACALAFTGCWHDGDAQHVESGASTMGRTINGSYTPGAIGPELLPDWQGMSMNDEGYAARDTATTGNCADYARACKAELISQGYAPERLRLYNCYIPTGAYHTVLVVDGYKVHDLIYPYEIDKHWLPYAWDGPTELE